MFSKEVFILFTTDRNNIVGSCVHARVVSYQYNNQQCNFTVSQLLLTVNKSPLITKLSKCKL